MVRWLCVAALVALGGCGTFTGRVANDPARDVLGVGAEQPRADAAAPTVTTDATRTLTFKERQICTRGLVPLRQDVEPAENGRALVDWTFACKPYDFTVLGYDLAGRVPF